MATLPSPISPSTTPDLGPFVNEGTTAVHRLRRALADILTSVGADPSEPQELSRRFNLDKTLTWRISRVIREEDAWEAVAHIPGRPSIRALIDKLQTAGAAREFAESVWKAMEQFERFVEVHSGDRETLEIMVGVGNRPSAAKRMELFRKQGFQANGAAWGVQAKAHFCFHVMMPSADPTMVDLAAVSGLVELRRLRPNTPWTIASAQAWETDRPEIDAGPEPLFPDSAVDGVPIIPSFCTQPLPRLRTKRSPGGTQRFELTEGELGYTGAVTIVVGWKWTQTASIYGSVPDDTGEHGLHLSTPVEVAIHDLLVHRSLSFALRPEAAAYSELPGGPVYPTEGRGIGRMPMPEDVTSLGTHSPSMTALEFPRYQELVDFTLARLGTSAQDFHGFRHRVRYPTIPTLAVLRHPLLPPKP